ncbi:MAG TPA: helix-turn-helix domain-containing protein [Caulobacteraceae bacterium]|jgi:AcrR family transcriptional regulator|nr:helix-turn-helix domain-containing protein [Caulobacteraceae bacterium]
MSENSGLAETPLDRRRARTRAALLKAFNDLVLSTGWDHFSAADVAVRADVGRSTLYEHFQGKEAMLAEAMRPLLSVLAEAGGAAPAALRLDFVVAHFWEQRRFARLLLATGAWAAILRELARHVEARLSRECAQTPGGPTLSRPAAAALIARAQLGLLEDWLVGHHHASVETLTRAMRATTNALIEALNGDSASVDIS